MKIDGRYASLILGAGALLFLAEHGIKPTINPFRDGRDGAPVEHVIRDTIDPSIWETLMSRKDVIFCLVWVFVTGGVGVTLPSDFNTASNEIHAIGKGGVGQGGFGGTGGSTCGSGGGCSGGC